MFRPWPHPGEGTEHLCQKDFEGQRFRNYNNPHLQSILPSDWDRARRRKGPGELGSTRITVLPPSCSILEWKV